MNIEQDDIDVDFDNMFFPSKRTNYRFSIDIEWSPKAYWAILPCLNININARQFEFEWLCLGIYIGKS